MCSSWNITNNLNLFSIYSHLLYKNLDILQKNTPETLLAKSVQIISQTTEGMY